MKEFHIFYLNTNFKFIINCKKILEKNFNLSVRIFDLSKKKEILQNRDVLIVDDCFTLFEDNMKPIPKLLLVNACLQTSFGKRILSEARDKVIILTSKIPIEQLERIIKHEFGHILGLNHHLNCLMSPFYQNNSFYCNKCKNKIKAYLKLD